MKNFFGTGWNFRIAINEMVGSTFLCLFIFMSFYWFKKNKGNISVVAGRLVISLLFSISLLTSLLITKSLAQRMGDHSEGLALLNPGVVLMLSIKMGLYDALWFLVLFEIIGSVIGISIFVVFIKLMGEKDIKRFFFQSSGPMLKFGTKELIFSFLLFIIVAFIGGFLPNVTGGNLLMNFTLLSICLFIIFLFSAEYGFFNFSIAIQLVNYGLIIILDFMDANALNNLKRFKLNQTGYTVLAFTTNMGMAIGVGLLLVLISKNSVGY